LANLKAVYSISAREASISGTITSSTIPPRAIIYRAITSRETVTARAGAGAGVGVAAASSAGVTN
jgi:hypothetical protein